MNKQEVIKKYPHLAKLPKKGWFFHLHHESVGEYSDDVWERIEYIVDNKPKHEIETRLDCIGLIKFKKGSKADAARAKADAARAKADAALLPYLAKLHDEQHPDCPWNGSTIFG